MANQSENTSKTTMNVLETIEESTNNDDLFDKSVLALPVVAIQYLMSVVQTSTAHTMMNLQEELTTASATLLESVSQNKGQHRKIALQSGIELFLKYVTRTFLETPSFDLCRAHILERASKFTSMSLTARDKIVHCALEFIHHRTKNILTLGWSRVVAGILLEASQQQQQNVHVHVVQGQPDLAGQRAAQCYAHAGISTTIVLDSAVGTVMEDMDMVLTGADAVVENGGVVNTLGTLTTAIVAHAYHVPVYVAAESYKFARLYPFKSADLELDRDSVDFTPSKYVTLLFTDLGVLTPSAVSDELIQLYS